jgi:hypothetical protein
MARGSVDVCQKIFRKKKPATPSGERAFNHFFNTFAKRLALKRGCLIRLPSRLQLVRDLIPHFLGAFEEAENEIVGWRTVAGDIFPKSILVFEIPVLVAGEGGRDSPSQCPAIL